MTELVRQQDRLFVRMRDVQLSLFGAARYNQTLGRIQLQKLVYLTDSISTLYDLLPPQVAHETYFHGPWDNAVQNAVDCLVFRGLAIAEPARHSADGKKICRYLISESGQHWAQKLIESSFCQQRWSATSAVCEQVNKLGWRRLRSLAYAEPTYASVQHYGYGQELRPYEFLGVSTGALLEIIKMALSPAWAVARPTVAALTEVYFMFLDRFDRQAPAKAQEG